jgi:hypothetical protein
MLGGSPLTERERERERKKKKSFPMALKRRPHCVDVTLNAKANQECPRETVEQRKIPNRK